MGTERKLARFPDILAPFFELILGRPVVVPDRQFLFPIALSAPGWNHGWDIVIRRGLASLLWFAGWLEGLKSIIAFCRSKIWRGQLVRHVWRVLKLPFVGDVIDAIRVPSVAEWRWGTFWSACLGLKHVVATLGH